ncbi:SDR family oxidoreductase [Aquirufa rosea]|uniref:SDR family oxidoreductase n=1 Tax=Aquirufa rosea TaxID=2509241 RepID=A0A4Q1BXM4_9BACT|nr:SDR family oxidoreductase [Aquirufa rosea]RXK47097.1 SDR family oxidoreductase [Aquirufa rosea]
MNKTVVISGGSQGIGKALVKKFISEGFNTFTCSRKAGNLAALQEEINNSLLHTFVADLSQKEQTKAFAEFVLGHTQQIDVLINNAGFFLPGQIQNEEDQVLERQIETNVYSAYHLTRALLPSFQARKAGHIFTICSTASITAYTQGGSYCISKYALLGFTKVLREELKTQGIKVTAVLPGATLTPSWDGVNLPASRFIPAEDIASTIWAAYQMAPSTVLEEILIRPQLGDIDLD